VPPTPILDLEQELPVKPKSTRSRRWRILALSLYCIAVLTFSVAHAFGFAGDLSLPRLPAFNLLLMLPALEVAILIHELGHAAAGRLAGMKLGALCAGGLMLAKSGRHWIFRFERRFLFGGITVPLTSQGGFGRGRHACMIAGGPMASVLLTAACGFAALRFSDGAWQWIGTLFWMSAFTVAITVIPYSTRGLTSDAGLLRMLYRTPERARCWMAAVALQAQNMIGVRPRDWDDATVQQALETAESDAHYAAVQLFAAYRGRDLGDVAGALEHLERALASAGLAGNPTVSRLCFLEAASASAECKHNPQQARAWLKRAQQIKAAKRPEETLGIEARIAMAEARFEDALDLWKRSRESIEKKRLDSGTARWAKERIAEAEQACRTALSKADFAAATGSPPAPSAAP
jgi:tetratricopeptide (TPR) repeat protein